MKFGGPDQRRVLRAHRKNGAGPFDPASRAPIGCARSGLAAGLAGSEGGGEDACQSDR